MMQGVLQCQYLVAPTGLKADKLYEYKIVVWWLLAIMF
jgi:hypothetical protein